MGRSFRTARIAIVAGLAIAGLAFAASPAQGIFHLMKIREVYVGSPANVASEFVELQMYAAGQNFVNGHTVGYFSAGGLNGIGDTFSANVPNGDNQRSILIASPAAEAEFGVQADLEIDTPDVLSGTGGAVCFENIDCVSWGSFPDQPGSPTGIPAPAIPAGSSLERSIAPNCPTLLEDADDTDDSATDFALAAPSPRNNATPPTETPCPGGGGNPGGGPDTKIDKGPKKKTKKKRAKFEFSSTTPGATFECSVDDKPFEACTSPHTVKVKKGKHTFEVRAVAGGVPDGSPAEQSWKVKKKKK